MIRSDSYDKGLHFERGSEIINHMVNKGKLATIKESKTDVSKSE